MRSTEPTDPGPVPGRASIANRRLACLLLLAFTLPVGLVWRLAPLGLPQFAFKYGGSALWAVGMYWLLAMLLPRWRPVAVGFLAAAIAAAVEAFKLVRSPGIDAFRATLPGKVLIGRYFTFGAIAAYWIAILGVALLDQTLQPGCRSRK